MNLQFKTFKNTNFTKILSFIRIFEYRAEMIKDFILQC